uniref:Small nuclear RNA activating complex, polypeptide 2 n=1 Tax=Cyprinus carpio TaxID=7962 RepID=A0A8C2E5S1_CYPCA
FESALGLTEIQKKVPQRSLKEIEDLIMTLKSRVLHKVYLQVRSQRREERKAKGPTELWAELVQKISRPYEKTISSAFSQMLVIAAIEPCGLMDSDPPHPIKQTPAFSSLHPIQSPETPSRHSSSGISSNSSISTPSVASLIQPDFSINAADHISQFDNASSSSPLVPKMPKTPTPRSLQMIRSTSELQSELHSSLHSQYTKHYTKPAKMPASSSNSDRDVLQANVADSASLPPKLRPPLGSTKELFSESSVTEPAKDKKDWVTAGTCPLNPLVVPIALLKRP